MRKIIIELFDCFFFDDWNLVDYPKKITVRVHQFKNVFPLIQLIKTTKAK